MVSKLQAKELIRSLVKRGEMLDPGDMTLFYGWVYSSYVALEPFPGEHCSFCKRCLDSFDPPDRKLRRGLLLLRSALGKLEKGISFPRIVVSEDYLKLLHRSLQSAQASAE